MYRAKTISRNFLLHMESLGSDNLSSDLSLFALYPKLGILLSCMESCLEAIYPELCTILKTITQNFFKPTNAFNSEIIVQVCLVSSQTHRVNKDFSNSVKDYTFQVPSDHFSVQVYVPQNIRKIYFVHKISRICF